MKDTERRNIMALDFKLTFNRNGELIELAHDRKKVHFPKGFHGEYERLTGVLMQTIPIDLKLLILKGDDPCITHKGRRY
jgi:hypothetical protein